MSKSCRLPDEEEVVNWFASLALRLRSDPLPTQELWSAQIERLRSAIAALRRERDNARIGRDDLRILAIEKERMNAALRGRIGEEPEGQPEMKEVAKRDGPTYWKLAAAYDRVLHNLAGSEIREAQLRERAEAAERRLEELSTKGAEVIEIEENGRVSPPLRGPLREGAKDERS